MRPQNIGFSDLFWKNAQHSGLEGTLSKKSGLPFEEVMEHFLIGLEETCLVADADGNVKILGGFGRRKHEKKVSDCRTSATMVRTGVFAGAN